MEEVVCRVCLSETGEFQTVFTSVELEETKSTMHLSEMICSFTHVQITLGDGLPEQICRTCAEETVNMYFFKIRCEESDKILRKKLMNKQTIKNNMDKQVIKNELPEPFEQPLQENNLLDDFDQGFSNFDYEDSLSDDNEQNIDLYYTNVKVEKPEKVKEFECTICQKRFTREDLLLRHKIAHAMKMQDFDDKVEDTEDSHSETNDEPKKTQNGIVEIDGTFVINEPSNILNNEKCPKVFKCILCNCPFANEETLDKHLAEEHLEAAKTENGNYFICKVCDQVIKDIGYFKRHIKKKHASKKSNRKYSCPYCFMEYTKKGNLKNHLSYHKSADIEQEQEPLTEDTDIGEFSCDHCEKIFKSKKDIKRHLSRIRILTKKIGSKKKPHVCEICLKAFNQISNLKDHLRTHNGEKPFLCPTCGKGFNQLGNLRQHQVRHSGIKSHICTTCGHGFASKGELHAHLRKHTGARPFVCDACGNGFTTSSSLTKHKRIHSGEKPYECDYCKMKFSRSGILSRHRRIHTGEKPYVCKICRKAFTQSNDLNSHLRIHTGEKPYKCDECGQPFRQSSALRTHKKTHLEPKPQHIRQLVVKKDREVFVEDEENILVKFKDLPDPM